MRPALLAGASAGSGAAVILAGLEGQVWLSVLAFTLFGAFSWALAAETR